MKDKALVIASGIPNVRKNSRDLRLYCIVKALAQRYELTFVFVQDMFADPASITELERSGVNVLSLKSFRSTVPGTSDKKIEEKLFQEKYKVIFFDTSITARFYLPAIEQNSPQSIIVIDTARAQYLANLNYARRSLDMYHQTNYCRSADNYRFKEISIYCHADVLITDGEDERVELQKDLPDAKILVVEGRRSAREGELTRNIGQVLVEMKKQHRRPGRDGLDLITVPVPSGEAYHRSLITAFNNVLKKPSKDFILLTTGDVVVPELAIESMLSCARVSPLHGVIMPVSNRSLGNITSEKNIVTFQEKHYRTCFGLWQEAKQVEGYCCLFRRELLEMAGVLDDRFQTIDYAFFDYYLKAFQAGYRALITHEAFVYYRSFIPASRESTEIDHQLLYEKWCDRGTSFLESLKEEDR